jgi:hypothetical protein
MSMSAIALEVDTFVFIFFGLGHCIFRAAPGDNLSNAPDMPTEANMIFACGH